jgi:hypothetical protein
MIEAILMPNPDVGSGETIPVGAAVADRAALRLPASHPLPARRPCCAEEVPELRSLRPASMRLVITR